MPISAEIRPMNQPVTARAGLPGISPPSRQLCLPNRNHRKHQPQPETRNLRHDQRSRQNAERDGDQPMLQQRHIRRAALLVRGEGADGSGHDNRRRRAQRQMHPHIIRHMHRAEHFKKRRHQHRAAANAEQAGQNTCDCAGGGEIEGEGEEVVDGKAGQGSPRVQLRNHLRHNGLAAGLCQAGIGARFRRQIWRRGGPEQIVFSWNHSDGRF
jgi:hypothetical protein